MPDTAAHASNGSRASSGGDHTGEVRKLYSMAPERSSSRLSVVRKSKLNSLSDEDAHGKLQPIRRR